MKRSRRSDGAGHDDRLTISLAPGQRAALERIAQRNDAPLAFVVRYALARFIASARSERQLELELP